MSRASKIFGVTLLAVIVSAALIHQADATETYARSTGKGRVSCHTESVGGQLQDVGFAYIRNGYQYPISERVLIKSHTLQSGFHQTLRFIIGYLHLLVAVIFFGAIFYIHIFIKPTRLTGGIPKHERLLGLSCMAILTASGIYLTWARIERWEQFFNNTFGLMLFIKILLFLLMITIGLMAVTIVHRRMKIQAEALPADGAISQVNIGSFDGADGKPAYFIHEDRVYDVTGNPKGKEGRHFGKHSSGSDLTEALAGAPHGREVFERINSLGKVAQPFGAQQNPGGPGGVSGNLRWVPSPASRAICPQQTRQYP